MESTSPGHSDRGESTQEQYAESITRRDSLISILDLYASAEDYRAAFMAAADLDFAPGHGSTAAANIAGSSSSSVSSIPSDILLSELGSGSDNSTERRDRKRDVLVRWIQMKQEQKGWTEGKPGEGVFVKKSKDFYAFAPLDAFSDDSGLYQSILEMNVRVS